MGRRSRSWNQTYQGQAGETHPNSEKVKRNFSGCSSSTKLECTEKMEHTSEAHRAMDTNGSMGTPSRSEEHCSPQKGPKKIGPVRL